MNTKTPVRHTPGPWIMEDAHENGPFGNLIRYIRGSDGFYPAMALSNSGDKGELMTANACLIAAAPDLLEALKNAVKAMDDFGYLESVLKPAKQAIAKAEGK